jgi:hypothetical protein
MRQIHVRCSSWLYEIVALTVFLGEMAAQAQDLSPGPVDEPGLVEVLDEPGPSFDTSRPTIADPRLPAFRLELAFGYSSLVVDPDLKDGIGGGIFIGYGLHRRIGVELSTYFAKNDYNDLLGNIGATFLAGNLSLGPIFQLTTPGHPFSLTAELGLGGYYIIPVFQQTVWTFGLSGGVTLAYRFTSWAGVGLKCRYHLFNLATISGPELKDLKSFMKVGVVDRLEIPGYLAFYF